MGDNKYGQIGRPDRKKWPKITLESKRHYAINKITNDIFSNLKVTKIFCGPFNTFFMCEKNCIFATGLNDKGQLGLKEKSCRGKTEKHELIVHQPQRVDTNNKTIKDIGCEKYRTYFLDTDGTAWGVGKNLVGGKIIIIEDPSKDIRGPFQKIMGDNNKNFKSLYSGYVYTIFRNHDNSLYGIGSNSFLQLKNEENTDLLTDLQHLNGEFDKIVKVMACGGNNSIIAYKDPNNNDDGDTILYMGDFITHIKKKTNYNVKFIACNDNHFLIADDDNKLYGAANRNKNKGIKGIESDKKYKNQLGLTYFNWVNKLKEKKFEDVIFIKDFNDIGQIKTITCGFKHSLILFENGKVYAAGSNKHRECGDESKCRTIFRHILAPIITNPFVFLATEGKGSTGEGLRKKLLNGFKSIRKQNGKKT